MVQLIPESVDLVNIKIWRDSLLAKIVMKDTIVIEQVYQHRHSFVIQDFIAYLGLFLHNLMTIKLVEFVQLDIFALEV